MNLSNIIPNNDRWIISKNIVYVDYIAKIPILVKSGDDIWVYLDIKIAKYVLQLVKILKKNNIDFLFKSTQIFFDQKFTDEEFHKINISQYLRNITDPVFFDGFYKIGFDYTNNLSKYLTKYGCYDEFKEIYNIQKNRLLSKSHDYWINKEVFYTKREDIRDYIGALEREIKINLLF